MATPVSRDPRRVRLPRSRPLVEPVSTVDAPFHRSGSFYVRVAALAVLAAGMLGALALRLWSLQLIQGPTYAKLAVTQSFRSVDLPGARGPIVDAQGRLLAGTRGRLVVVADGNALGTVDAGGRWHASRDGLRQLRNFSAFAHVPLATLVKRIGTSVLHSPYAPAVVIDRPGRPLAFYLGERPSAYPAIRVEALPVRNYPQGGLGTEFLGLLGEISPQQLKGNRYPGAKPGEIVGQSGVEATYDSSLNGGFQRARLRVDSRGRIVGPLVVKRRGKPLPTLHLTIDARIQRAAERAIEHGITLAQQAGHLDAAAGAAVVMNAHTGALLALASYPDYNQLLAARDPGYYQRLLHGGSAASPLINRAVEGLYPTGSTFKPIVAEAALATGIITPSTYLPCTGSLQVGNMVFHNVEPYINTTLTLPQAISISCDTWFYRLGVQFYYRQERGSSDIQHWAKLLGLGHPTGIDLPGDPAGIMPTPAWLRKTFTAPWARIWYEGTSVNLSIGQGYLAVSPLQLAVAYAALANGGTVVRPHVASAIGSKKLTFKPVRRVHLPGVAAIREGLYSAAHDPGGTSSSVFANFAPAVDGKTGTAQAPPGSDHSWYASWAPANDPRYVVVVMIEHGGYGVQAAAPATRDIYTALFHHPKTRGN